MSRFFHCPIICAGPLHLEWAAARYERMQAQRDARAENPTRISWDDPYVKAALNVEGDAYRATLDFYPLGPGRKGLAA